MLWEGLRTQGTVSFCSGFPCCLLGSAESTGHWQSGGQQQHWAVAAGELRQSGAHWPALNSHVNRNILGYSGLCLERQYSLFSPASERLCLSGHGPPCFSLLRPNQLQLREHYKTSLTNIIHCFLLWWVIWGTCWRKKLCMNRYDLFMRVYYLQKATSTQKVTIICWTNRTFVADKINLEILKHRLHYLRRKENIWIHFEILLFQLTFLIAYSFVLRTYL